MTGCSRRHSGVFTVPHSCFGAVVNTLLCFKINPLSAALSLPLFVLSIASVSGLSGSTWKSPGLHTSAEMWGWNMLCVHIVTSLGPKGIPAIDYKLSTCKALMNLWSALARWTLRVFPFVYLHEWWLPLILFQSLLLYFRRCVLTFDPSSFLTLLVTRTSWVTLSEPIRPAVRAACGRKQMVH